MQLAADPIVIEIAGEVHELRPTLRAALRLTRKHGDFATLYNGILADHVTVSGDVVREATGSPHAAEMFGHMLDMPGRGVRDQLNHVKLPLLRYVAQLAGIETSDTDQAALKGKPMPFADYYAELFSIGTGWLGWSAEDTWEASPAEILAAQRGRTDLLSSILHSVFGDASLEKAAEITPVPDALNGDGTDPSFDRSALAALRASYQRAA